MTELTNNSLGELTELYEEWLERNLIPKEHQVCAEELRLRILEEEEVDDSQSRYVFMPYKIEEERRREMVEWLNQFIDSWYDLGEEEQEYNRQQDVKKPFFVIGELLEHRYIAGEFATLEEAKAHIEQAEAIFDNLEDAALSQPLMIQVDMTQV